MLIVLPEALSYCTVQIFNIAAPMTHVVPPLPLITFAIFPAITTKSMFQIHVIFSLILLTIGPEVVTLSVHCSL